MEKLFNKIKKSWLVFKIKHYKKLKTKHEKRRDKKWNMYVKAIMDKNKNKSEKLFDSYSKEMMIALVYTYIVSGLERILKVL